jgi:lipoprotein-anchoring transpeptidase ErfK/SrfK
MLGGVGVLPSVASGDDGDTTHDSTAAADSVLAGAATTPSAQPSTEPSTQPSVAAGSAKGKNQSAVTSTSDGPQDDAPAGDTGDPNPPVPDDSGDGRRIVFDQSDQRVWLVDEDEDVERTYLVSGSLYDNLEPGTYSVYSKSEQAWGIDDSGTMQYFVRFTEGTNGAAIGFHDIPIDNGEFVQTVDELGTPQSHGCVRQERDDAIALWEFAPVGTEVDVTA